MPILEFSNHRIFYRQQGAGPLLILLPGNTATSVCFQSELDYFASSYTVVSLDFLGTGLSERSESWPVNWWRDNAKQISALIAHLDLGPALLLGTSGGGISALWTAIDFPAQVRAVVADSVPARFSGDLLRHVLAERRDPPEDLVRFYHHAQGEDWQAVIEADNSMLERFFTEYDGDVFGNRLLEICCPVLFTASRQDNFLIDPDATQTAMARAVRHGRLYMAPKGGHPFMWTAADEFRAVAGMFLSLQVKS